ncbi:MAG: MurR/RpiR family transcriptional regulator [Rhodobacteraceae bacterium]|nr:MurR/RpiR family transcriptional regulator [Paracoccaceae bacterium]
MAARGLIRDQISSKLGGLSPQLKRAARYLLDHPDEVATQSLRHIAQNADLPPPTFSRLARAVGCGSYNDLRDMFREEYRMRSSRFSDRALALLQGRKAEREGSEHLLFEHANASFSAVQQLLERTDLDRLDATAARLADARRVALIGALSAAAFVEYAGYVSGIALPNWSVLGRNGSSLSSQIMDLGPEDAAISVAIAPYARRTVRAARLAKQQGAYSLAVTDGAASPLVEIADASLFVSSEGPQFFPSHVSMLVLLETLIGLVIRRKGIETQRRISDIEQYSAVLGDYWRDESPA